MSIPKHSDYEAALVMLDELMAQAQAHNPLTCALMEAQELTLMRLQQLRQTLKPQDDAQIAAIAAYYQRQKAD